MRKPIQLFLFSLILLGIFTSCSTPKENFTWSEGGDIWFRNLVIDLRLDANMNLQVFYKNGDEPLNSVETNPSHFIKVNGKEITDFTVDYDQIAMESVETDFGNGRKLTVKGFAETENNLQIKKTLFIELYDKYPDAAIISASHKNTGTSEIRIDKSVSNYSK